MRRIIVTGTAAAMAIAGMTAVADARIKPTIRQLSIYASWTNTAMIKGVGVNIVRTDHKHATGVRVCLQERNWHAPSRTWTVACSYADRFGYHYFPHREKVSNGEQWRVYHPETTALARYHGPWSYGTLG